LGNQLQTAKIKTRYAIRCTKEIASTNAIKIIVRIPDPTGWPEIMVLRRSVHFLSLTVAAAQV